MSEKSLIPSLILATLGTAKLQAEANLTQLWADHDTLMKNAPDDLEGIHEILGLKDFSECMQIVGQCSLCDEITKAVETIVKSQGYVDFKTYGKLEEKLKEVLEDEHISDDGGDGGAAGSATDRPGDVAEADRHSTPEQPVSDSDDDPGS